VSASDNLSNSSTEQTNFVVRATSASLLTNVTKAYQSGLIKNSGVYSSLKSKLTNAVAAHNKAKHATEREILTALVLDLKAARGKSIDTATANLLIAFTVDLINSGG
jgi:hypothetical protein